MIKLEQGNLLDSKASVLVNTVNCVGVMGKGIALQFKRHFPNMYEDYRSKCMRGEIKVGEVTTFEEQECVIVNFPTKIHWKHPSTYDYVDSGLSALAHWFSSVRHKSIAIPALGCNNGGLDWNIVLPKIVDAFSIFDDRIVQIYEPMKSYET